MRDDRGAVGLDWGSQDPQDPPGYAPARRYRSTVKSRYKIAGVSHLVETNNSSDCNRAFRPLLTPPLQSNPAHPVNLA